MRHYSPQGKFGDNIIDSAPQGHEAESSIPVPEKMGFNNSGEIMKFNNSDQEMAY